METGPEKSSTLRRALRTALTTIKWLGVAACVCALLVVLVNLRDEDLTPEAKALATFHRPTVPDGQNAYLALVGFDAPAGVDPIAEGGKIVAEHDIAARGDPSGAERAARLENTKSAESGDGRLRFVGDVDKLCDPLEQPCLPAALAVAGNIQTMQRTNQELVARYFALQSLSVYANTSTPDSMQPMPSGGWAGARRLLFTQAAIDLQSGHDDRALAFLAADMAMWRRVLASGSGLIDKMIAVRMLASGVALLSEFVATPTFEVRNHLMELRQMLTPLTPAESDAGAMFTREYQLASTVLASNHEEATRSAEIDWPNRQLIRLLYKKNASLNQSAKFYEGLQSLGSHPPAEFVELKSKLDRESTWMSEPGISWVYNPIGKTLVGIAIPAYSDFVARVFDLAAYVRLVRAQLEVRLADLPSDRVPPFLAAAGAETRNPYTGQPFAWNPATRSVSFEQMNSRSWSGWKPKANVPPSATQP